MILHRILVILLCILLFLGVYGALAGRDAPSFSSLMYSLENSSEVFESDWIDDVRIPELDADDYPLISDLVTFFNDVLLAPIRFILTVSVMALNVFAFVWGYYVTFIV